jgi:hypothetical protein
MTLLEYFAETRRRAIGTGVRDPERPEAAARGLQALTPSQCLALILSPDQSC